MMAIFGRKSRIILLLFLSLICLFSCRLFYHPKELETVKDFAFDGFEINDGFRSTLYNWDLSGSELPFIQSQEKHSGNYAIQLGNLNDHQASQFQIKILTQSNQVFSFWYKADCQTYYDSLRFYINDHLYVESSSSEWTEFTCYLVKGEYILRWRYKKDDRVSEGRDTAWVDDISLDAKEYLFYDDFEINNGIFSTRYEWYHSGDGIPFVQTSHIHSGEYAVQFEDIDDWQYIDCCID